MEFIPEVPVESYEKATLTNLLRQGSQSLEELHFSSYFELESIELPIFSQLRHLSFEFEKFRPQPRIQDDEGLLVSFCTQLPAITHFSLHWRAIDETGKFVQKLPFILWHLTGGNQREVQSSLSFQYSSINALDVLDMTDTSSLVIRELDVGFVGPTPEHCSKPILNLINRNALNLHKLSIRGSSEAYKEIVLPNLPALEEFYLSPDLHLGFLPFRTHQFPNLKKLSIELESLVLFKDPMENVTELDLSSIRDPPKETFQFLLRNGMDTNAVESRIHAVFPNIKKLTHIARNRHRNRLAFGFSQLTHLTLTEMKINGIGWDLLTGGENLLHMEDVFTAMPPTIGNSPITLHPSLQDLKSKNC